MRLLFASVFTLGLLSTFVASILFGLMYYTGFIDIYLLLGLTVLFNLLVWLAGPWVSDLIYTYLYKVEWVELDELRHEAPEAADIINATCNTYGFSTPKLGVIPDQNPNAFTYGSGRWNSRIIATEGLFHYLDGNESAAVYAHELGHIVHRDFIVMSIANTLIQLLYELYIISRSAAASGSGRRGKGKAPLLGIAIAAYLFYFIGQYILRYLSRVREYYADQFSARVTDANHLSSALIKVSYGLLVNPDDRRLMASTKALGIQNFDAAEDVGLVYYNCERLEQWDALNRTLLYDLVSPWATLTELSSTHPLTGKRIKRLSTLTDRPMFDFTRIRERVPVDKTRLYGGFVKDIGVLLLPALLILGFPVLSLWYYGFSTGPYALLQLVGGWLIAAGIGFAARTLYKYPPQEAQDATVLDLLGDLYASPVRGRAVQLQGELVGRGEAGFVLSEDLMLQDDTGLMFLNYQHWFPFLGNLLFGLNRIPDLIGQRVQVDGWFLRSVMPWLGLRFLDTGAERIRGYLRLGGLLTSGLLIVGGIAVIAFL